MVDYCNRCQKKGTNTCKTLGKYISFYAWCNPACFVISQPAKTKCGTCKYMESVCTRLDNVQFPACYEAEKE